MKIAMGEEFSNAWAFTLNLTPVALSAAIKAQEQAFSVPAGTLPTGIALATTDSVFVSPPAQNNSLCPAAYAFVSAGQVVIGFANLTAAANTPVAGLYTFFVVRP